jgi:hypothetical protein
MKPIISVALLFSIALALPAPSMLAPESALSINILTVRNLANNEANFVARTEDDPLIGTIPTYKRNEDDPLIGTIPTYKRNEDDPLIGTIPTYKRNEEIP